MTSLAPRQPSGRKVIVGLGAFFVLAYMFSGSHPPRLPADPAQAAAIEAEQAAAERERAAQRAAAAQARSVAEAQKAAELAATEQLTPTVERSFIQAVEAGKREYDAGANDMAKGASRPHRKTALCSLFRGSGPVNWTGTIADLSSNSDGKGVLAITIAKCHRQNLEQQPFRYP
jgi:multidrug efflux pump subunit AcrA (membrane-fusion protein)